MAARGAEPDEPDLDAARAADVERARHDGIVEAEVLGGPHAVEAVLFRGIDDRQGVGESAEPTEGNAQPHRTLRTVRSLIILGLTVSRVNGERGCSRAGDERVVRW